MCIFMPYTYGLLRGVIGQSFYQGPGRESHPVSESVWVIAIPAQALDLAGFEPLSGCPLSSPTNILALGLIQTWAPIICILCPRISGVGTKLTLWGPGPRVLGEGLTAPTHQLGGFRELLQWGPGQNHGRQEFWVLQLHSAVLQSCYAKLCV